MKAKAKAKYKTDCYFLSKVHPKPVFENDDIHLFVTFNPATLRSFDLDNALASIKSALDGICIAWGIDDKRFNPITIKRGVVKKIGSIEISVD